MGTRNGTAVISPEEPVVAGEYGTWTVTYTAGAEGIGVGGSVRFEIPYGFTPPQLMWPGDVGYVRARCSRLDARLELTLEPPVKLDPEPFYYVTRWGRMVYVQVLDAALVEGDQIEFEYGWRMHGLGGGARAQYFAQTAELTVATDVDGTRSAKFSGYTLVAEQPRLVVVGDETEALRVVAPSVVAAGELVQFRVVPLDCFGNLSSMPMVGLDLAGRVDDPEVESLWGAERGMTMEARFDVPGEKMLTVEEEVRGYSNPIIVLPREPELRLFWGDIHGHTVLSDGLGTPTEYYEFGREEALLDFCAIADHAQYMSDEDWELTQQAAREFNDPRAFVTLLGYEYSCNANMERYGDKVLYYPGDEGPLLRETDIMRTRYHDMAEFAPTWKQHGAMMVLHQHGRGSCSYYDPELVRLAEVYSVWGASESTEATRPLLPAMDHDYSGHYVADALEKGWRLGMIASSDDHAGRPGATDWLRVKQAYPGGLVAVWAPVLTREAVWEALWNRRCYGTTGARIIVDFHVDGEPMGSVISSGAFSGAHQIKVRVLGEDALTLVEVLRGRETIYATSSFGPLVSFEIMDQPAAGAANYYYLRVVQADGEMAWSSPVWVG